MRMFRSDACNTSKVISEKQEEVARLATALRRLRKKILLPSVATRFCTEHAIMVSRRLLYSDPSRRHVITSIFMNRLVQCVPSKAHAEIMGQQRFQWRHKASVCLILTSVPFDMIHIRDMDILCAVRRGDRADVLDSPLSELSLSALLPVNVTSLRHWTYGAFSIPTCTAPSLPT